MHFHDFKLFDIYYKLMSRLELKRRNEM